MLSLASLNPQNFTTVQAPDPTKRFKTLADARAMQQTEQIRGQQIQQNDMEMQAQQQAMQKAAAVHDVLVKNGGDFEKALPELGAIAPDFAFTVRKELDAQKRDAEKLKIDKDRLFNDQIKAGDEARDRKERTQIDRDKLKLEQDKADIIETSPGASLFSKIQNRSLFTAPTTKTESKPASVQEYEYAKTQGYQGTYNDYQNMDANRRRQMVNINLEKLRELDLENKTVASPGQVVFKSSGRPVGQQMPETAATRLEGLQTAIGQADIVEQALLKLGNSGAVKGYIEENGVYWPVVQDKLTPEQAAAVSETNRLLSAYAQAVSGLAVSEPEIRRLQRSAPSVKLTPEANKVILGHFRRNAIAKRDNYLDLRGWKLATEDAPKQDIDSILDRVFGPPKK